jgi:hypothetical protein
VIKYVFVAMVSVACIVVDVDVSGFFMDLNTVYSYSSWDLRYSPFFALA